MLQRKTTEVLTLTDLCGSSVNKSELEQLKNIAKINIIACFPRAVKWLLHQAGIPIEEKNFNFFNMISQSIEEFETFSNQIQDDISLKVTKFEITKSSDWSPWFPVIDYNRCINCLQCVSFCLFGVYHVADNKKVIVKNPANCKTNCPACGRICPEAAIIFPKVDESPINGDEITDEENVKANIKNNVENMLGDDVYAALAKRKKKARLLKLRKKAESERKQFVDLE